MSNLSESFWWILESEEDADGMIEEAEPNP